MATINVKDALYGAYGDGQPPGDSQTFRRALDALDLVAPRPPDLLSGGILVIPAGVYLLTEPLVVRYPAILQGEGSQASLPRFQRQQADAKTTISGVIVNGADASIRDLTIMADGPGFNSGAQPPNVPPDLSDADSFYGLRITNFSKSDNWLEFTIPVAPERES